MAFPDILINNSTGSDTAASGAGPGTAITGSNASTNGGGTVVTLPNADLSGVAVDGSHALWLDTGSGRQYSKITAKADSGLSTANVTVESAYTGSLSGQTYAIGGKRATLDHADTRTLFADALPGWFITLEETGTDYTLTSLISTTTGGTEDGAITLRSTSPTRPTITSSVSGLDLFRPVVGDVWTFEHLRFHHSGAVRGDGFSARSNLMASWLWRDCVFDGLKIAINGAWTASQWSFSNAVLDSCEILNCTSHGIENHYGTTLIGCYIHDNAGDGWNVGSAIDFSRSFHLLAVYSVFARNGGENISMSGGGFLRITVLIHCVLDSAVSHNLDLLGDAPRTLILLNNVLYGGGGYGVTLTNVPTVLINQSNAYGANTSGARNNLPAGTGDVTLSGDPFVNRTGHDYTPDATAGEGAALLQAGYPGLFTTALVAEGYPDIGLVQVEPAAGGGGLPLSRIFGGL